jgi:hypothetical protein
VIGLLTEPGFDGRDAGLPHENLSSKLGDALFEDLAPRGLVGERALDPAQRLRDGVVLSLLAVEAAGDLIDVAESGAAEIIEFGLESVDAPVDLREVALGNLLGLGVRHERATAICISLPPLSPPGDPPQGPPSDDRTGRR